MDLSGLSPVIIRAWLPKDALPQASDEADEDARKPLETLLELIPERLRQSGPFAKIKALTAVIADNHAKLAAGEVTEEDCDRKAEVSARRPRAAEPASGHVTYFSLSRANPLARRVNCVSLREGQQGANIWAYGMFSPENLSP